MNKILALLVLLGLCFAACNKKDNQTGCQTNRACTMEFAAIGVEFVDSSGQHVAVKDITVVNLRTGAAIVAKNVIDPGFSPDTHYIATDSNKDEFSTEGDDVKVTATSVATSKTVSATLKISGGCNCHIAKLSGSQKIVID